MVPVDISNSGNRSWLGPGHGLAWVGLGWVGLGWVGLGLGRVGLCPKRFGFGALGRLGSGRLGQSSKTKVFNLGFSKGCHKRKALETTEPRWSSSKFNMGGAPRRGGHKYKRPGGYIGEHFTPFSPKISAKTPLYRVSGGHHLLQNHRGKNTHNRNKYTENTDGL